MRFPTLFIPLLSLVPLAFAAAPPTCVLTCVGASALFKSCAQNDSQCLCTNRKFVREVSHCLERECGTDGDVAREYLSAYCLDGNGLAPSVANFTVQA